MENSVNQFIFKSPGPILLELGDYSIRWYGFLIAIAFLTCLFAAGLVAKKRNLAISYDDLSNFAIAIILGGLIGARAWFVILNLEYYLTNNSEILQIWLGGQSIQGGLVGAVIGSLIYESFAYKLSEDKVFKFWEGYLSKLSLVAIVTPLGQAIGRFGNFFNEEAYGAVTDVSWGLFISHTGQLHHPTFLYESLLSLTIFVIMLIFMNRLSNLQIIALYIFLYSSARLVLEPLRLDSLYIGSFKAASLVAIVGILIAAIVFAIDYLKKQK